jgi:hypothetical protein
MNRIRRLRRSLACPPRRAGALAAFAAAPAAWRPDSPFRSGWNDYLQLPPGWRKHPPLPLGHVADRSLITATAVLLAAALALAAYRMRSRPGAAPRGDDSAPEATTRNRKGGLP